MQHLQQRRGDDQGLGLADEIGEGLAAQGLREAPELPHAAVRRGRMEAHHARERVGEEPLGIPQERAFALHAPKPLEQGRGDDLRVRKPPYGLS
jgi:hypothetical protein